MIVIFLFFQTAKGYILMFDVLGGQDDKYLYEPVYPKWVQHTYKHTYIVSFEATP